MMNLEGKKILITGGSSGIGKALIAELYKKNAREFAIVGRSLKKMEILQKEFPNAKFLLLQGDVSILEDLKKIFVTLENKWKKVDMLINSAGVVSAGSLEAISDEDIIAQQNVNTTGLILTVKYALPFLKKSENAVMINVSSGLGLIGLPFYAPYAASKAAVRQFSESLRRELKFPIHVMTVYPTGTNTPMMETAETGKLDSAEKVAQATLEGLEDKKIDVVLGGDQRLKDWKMNFEHPLEFDKKVEKGYEAMKKRAAKHRAM